MRLLVGFSLVASALAVIGIYGVISLSVSSRRREIAIRTAVGAEGRHILKLVFSEGFRMILVGLILGAGIARILAQGLRTLLFGVQPTDPVTFIGMAILLCTVSLLACYWPARHAARVDPMEALRWERGSQVQP